MSVTQSSAAVRPGMDAVSKVMAGIGAGLLAGLVGGVVARVMMRFVALVIGEVPGFNLGATLMICVAFGIFVVPGAVAAAFRARRTTVALLVLGAGAVAFATVAEAVTVLEDRVLTTGQGVTLLVVAVGFLAAVLSLAVAAWWFARRFTTPR
ncbi:hypothetical protein [Xylanimonas protaetiae]|uniref:Uncharacterized protein n=1 Tax=Xylanimonas protaetiae TaxID=2509457 RepID=A0A4P6F279_9MICO|nr:hypothetical protein [Xylanimonas protaetiae]QAY69642.1 hypothetical protein ET471_05975 [Xylanimonas protaetiae]